MKSIFTYPRDTSVLRSYTQTLNYFAKRYDKSYLVTITEIRKKKTNKQNNGFHRIISLLVPEFQKLDQSIIYTTKLVKDYIKHRANYYHEVSGVSLLKSISEANLEEMHILINVAQDFAVNDLNMKPDDVDLTSHELRELEDYYRGL